MYADLLYKTDGVKITAVCDINPDALDRAKEKYGLGDEQCFLREEDFFKEKRGDAVVIATMDKLHVGHADSALALGYDVLLEKPIATSAADCEEIERSVKNTAVACSFATFYGIPRFSEKSRRLSTAGS